MEEDRERTTLNVDRVKMLTAAKVNIYNLIVNSGNTIFPQSLRNGNFINCVMSGAKSNRC